MTQERYQRINSLADAALELPEPQRSKFLTEACGEDTELLREVTELLGAQVTQGGFMESPLLDQLAQDMVGVGSSGSDLAGKRFQHYQILSRLGAGGLGEVWLAKDDRLGREVALKMLSRISAADPAQIRRFQREARTASSLNHPNIVTIYEIGDAEEYEYIAQEFVPGQTLRRRLGQGPIPIDTVLNVGAQISAALAAAHLAGIVHRDIKPENIMLRPDGLVKVLDFGLARFIEETSVATRTTNLSITRPGIVLGTAKYMSPEQARGQTVDARSDVFSLGAVLYEMAARRAPFDGRTTSDIMAAILAKQPEPISSKPGEVPQPLQQVIDRCLQKDPAKRYENALGLKLDLERILYNSRNSHLPRSAPGRGVRTPAIRALAIASVAAIALALIGASWYFLRNRHAGAPVFSSMRVTRLAIPGRVIDTAISPDGAYVAYFVAGANGQSLWMRQVSSSLESRILPPEDGAHTALAFSGGGKYITWLRSTSPESYTLYRMSLAESGGPAVVRSNLNSAVAFSPDSEWYAYFRIDPVPQRMTLMVASIDGKFERAITARERPRYFGRYGLAWSPDGHSIACFAGDAAAYTDQAFHLVSIRLADGQEKSIGSQRWLWGGSIAWPTQDSVFVSATEELDDAYQLWDVSTDDGAVTRLTNDLSDHTRVSAASDGKTVVALQTRTSADIWVMPGSDTERALQINSSDVSGLDNLTWTKDGRILYSAVAGDFRNIWIIDSDGGRLKQLTSGPGNKQELVATPDGKYVLYHSQGTIWRMDLSGRNMRNLTHGADDTHPEPSSDSRFVYYGSFRGWTPGFGGKPTLWRVSIDGEQPVRISNLAASVPTLSPDGRLLACEYFPGLDPQISKHDVAILRSSGGLPLQILSQLPDLRGFVSWDPSGDAIDFKVTTAGVDNIWQWPVHGNEPRQITNFRSGSIASFAWSPGGHKLAVARENTTRDVVLMRSSGPTK